MLENLEKDEMRREIPEKFRASTDPADKAAFELLQKNDEEQAKLAETLKFPFVGASPRERARAAAQITIRELEEIRKAEKLQPNQIEDLAEAYALIGLFEKAACLTLNVPRRIEFIKLHNAVWLDDEDWCDHSESQKYIKDNVWSIRESRELPVLACNECGLWNVRDAPERLLQAQRARAEMRAAKGKLSEPEFNKFAEKFKRKDL